MMKKSNKIILVVVCGVVLLAAGFFLMNSDDSPLDLEAGPPNREDMEFSREVPAGSKMYHDAEYRFSFFYPENFSLGDFSDEANTKTVLVQNTYEHGFGVQIYISSFDEDIMLTKERIKKDEPDIVMNDTQIISIGQDSKDQRFDLKVPQGRILTSTQAVSFQSINPTGQSREVWFVHLGNLYQITAPIAGEEILNHIIQSWRWNNKK